MPYDKRKMQDIKFSEKELWNIYTTAYSNGKVLDKGIWASGTNYEAGNFVTYSVDGGRYMCVSNTNSALPTDTTYWTNALQYKVLDAKNWNRLINLISDKTSDTPATTDSIEGLWNSDYTNLLDDWADFKFRGVWQSGTAYKKNNLVKSNTSNYISYFCIQDIPSPYTKPLTDTQYWVIAQEMLAPVEIQVSKYVPANLMPGDIYYKELLVVPIKGEIINLNLDGNGNKPYRVLKTNLEDRTLTSSQVELLYMDSTPISSRYYTDITSSDITNFGSETGVKYDGSELDTYLNTTWYNSLTQTAKDAIVARYRNQELYQVSTDSETRRPYYVEESSPTYYTYINGGFDLSERFVKRVYSLSFQDMIDYLNIQPNLIDKSTTTLTKTNIWKMIWNQTTAPQGEQYFNPNAKLWLSSASKNDPGRQVMVIVGKTGMIGFDAASKNSTQTSVNYFFTRPVFTIDLSKITWTN